MFQPTRQFQIVTPGHKAINHPTELVAFFAADGSPLIVGVPDTGNTVLLTGYTPPAGSNVLATDTVSQAIKKLDVRMRAASPAI